MLRACSLFTISPRYASSISFTGASIVSSVPPTCVRFECTSDSLTSLKAFCASAVNVSSIFCTFAEWLSVTYGDQGIKVSALCPQGVRTPMLTTGLDQGHLGAKVTAAAGPVLTPDEVADAVVAGLAEERFLILPHPEVERYLANKVRDPDAWLGAMRQMIGRV